ncbi:MAG: branched-chain amino acid ABC transporter permease, partial [Ardenticatenia bacterium]|nr:branched-chain amino acid ABC transporter permease [Ardenticatenia bacterium]
LGIVTLAFAEIASPLGSLALSSITGGEEGIIGIASLVRGSIYLKYYVSLAFMLVCVLTLYTLTRSKIGLILLAIKADDMAAEAAGVNTTRYKLLAFLISAFFGGLAGAYYAHYLNIANPETLAIPLSAAAITMTLVGGMGTIIGPVIGAYVLSLFFDLLPIVAGRIEFLTESRVLVYNVLIVLIVLFMPQGIVGWWRQRHTKPTSSHLDAEPSRHRARA